MREREREKISCESNLHIDDDYEHGTLAICKDIHEF